VSVHFRQTPRGTPQVDPLGCSPTSRRRYDKSRGSSKLNLRLHWQDSSSLSTLEGLVLIIFLVLKKRSILADGCLSLSLRQPISVILSEGNISGGMEAHCLRIINTILLGRRAISGENTLNSLTILLPTLLLWETNKGKASKHPQIPQAPYYASKGCLPATTTVILTFFK
jgi:hypothetical protein